MLKLMRVATFLFSFLLTIQIFAADWPQFLGPNRNGVIPDDSFVQAWLKDKIKERWRVPIGEGYSGLAIQGDSVFTMDKSGSDEYVVALRLSDGKEVWRVPTGSSPDDVYGGLGPRMTPSSDSDLVFVVSANGDLIALRTDNGRIVWKRSLQPELGWRPPAEGTSCSPLIQEGRLYVMIGGGNGRAFGAFDRNNGKTLWISQDDRSSYSSPVFWNFGGTKQVLFLGGSSLFSLNARTGELLWKYPWPTYDFVNVATPLVLPPDRVFISAGYDQGAAMLRIQKKPDGMLSAIESWRNREMKNHFNNSVFHDAVIYGFDNSVLKGVDAVTGKTLWREKGFGTGSIIRSGNYLIILSDTGELTCAKASPQSLNVLKKLQVLKGKTWTPPSLTDHTLLLRNQNEIVCLFSNEQ